MQVSCQEQAPPTHRRAWLPLRTRVQLAAGGVEVGGVRTRVLGTPTSRPFKSSRRDAWSPWCARLITVRVRYFGASTETPLAGRASLQAAVATIDRQLDVHRERSPLLASEASTG